MPKKLRAERPAKDYKRRISAYLKEVWKQNKDYLEEKIEDYGGIYQNGKLLTKEQLFYRTVKEIWREKRYDETLGRNIRNFDEAIDQAQRSMLISKRTHYQELLVDEITSSKDTVYKRIKFLIGGKKIDPNAIEYLGEQETGTNWEKWYEYRYMTKKYQVKAKKGKNKDKMIWKRTKNEFEDVFYIVFHVSQKSGGGGYYEIVEKPEPEQLKDLKK